MIKIMNCNTQHVDRFYNILTSSYIFHKGSENNCLEKDDVVYYYEYYTHYDLQPESCDDGEDLVDCINAKACA